MILTTKTLLWGIGGLLLVFGHDSHSTPRGPRMAAWRDGPIMGSLRDPQNKDSVCMYI